YYGKTTDVSNFLFGIPLHKRSSRKMRSIYGMFSGFLPLKVDYNSDYILSDLLRNITQTQKKDYRHQNHLIGDLSRHLKININEGYLTDIIVNYEPLNFEVNFGKDVKATILRLSNEYQVNPLQLVWREYGVHRPLELHVHFLNEYFNKQEIELLTQRILFIIDQFPDNLNNIIGSINILPPSEQHLLKTFTNTNAAYPEDTTLVDLFEKQVRKTPLAVAIVFGEQELNYQELNEQANRFAHFLGSKGISKEVLVPICLERGVEMIVGILGILKAGGAYVPIDPEYPLKRINYILEDTSATLLVTSVKSAEKLAFSEHIDVVEVDGNWIEDSVYSADNAQIVIVPGQLAYVIYTSGSTGLPKGVMIEHGSVVNLIEHQTRLFKIGEGEKILQFSNFSFDASVEQMFLSFRTGSTLLLINREVVGDQLALLHLIEAEKVTHFHATASYLQTIRSGKYGNLKRVISGGEFCLLQLAKSWNEHVNFFNEYGPTETTVTIVEHNYCSDSSYSVLPIGKPVSNSQIYILNKEDELLPIGVVGELHIGGVQVARGYLNRAELTAEKFVRDPFSV
ncbi:MAG TPA: amino acid adenylation domain-containing protein, partial [Segetibacter sp.]